MDKRHVIYVFDAVPLEQAMNQIERHKLCGDIPIDAHFVSESTTAFPGCVAVKMESSKYEQVKETAKIPAIYMSSQELVLLTDECRF